MPLFFIKLKRAKIEKFLHNLHKLLHKLQRVSGCTNLNSTRLLLFTQNYLIYSLLLITFATTFTYLLILITLPTTYFMPFTYKLSYLLSYRHTVCIPQLIIFIKSLMVLGWLY